MRSLAETLYAANPSQYVQYLDEGETGVTQNNYFKMASVYRLGKAQYAQFQSTVEQGASWHWGSKFNESGQLLDGDNLVIEGAYYRPVNHSADNTSVQPQTGTTSQSTTGRVWIENNSLSDMPRSLYSGSNAFGGYYNFYAATAESGKYSDASGTSSDSLCPSGWKLSTNGGTKSYAKLSQAYDIYTSDSSSSEFAKKLPLSIGLFGQYAFNTGRIIDSNGNGNYWFSTIYNSTEVRKMFITGSSFRTASNNGSSKTNGLNIRCVLK